MMMNTPQYDAVIVGSGISGALIAKQLGLKGKRVLILEAGAEVPANIDAFLERFFLSTGKVPEIPYTPEIFTPPGGNALTDPGTWNAGRPTVLTLNADNWQDPKQAYLIQQGPLAFGSTYDRVGAGTTRHWLGTSLRFVPNDFKMKTVYGRFVDWPFGYDELEAWYGRAEYEIGVSADKANQDYLGITFPPDYNYPMPSIPMSMVDDAVAAGITGLTIDGVALTVTETPAGRNSQPYQSRRVCAGNTNCIPICPIQAKYDASVTLNDALQTGNVEIRYRTVASEVVVGGDGQVSQINYLQYQTENGPQTGSGSVTAKIYIMAGHAIETPKLLLMSTNGGRTPNGVANSSGMVGRNLMDHPLYLAWALAPAQLFPYRGPLSTSGIENLRDGPFRKERAAYRIEIGNEGWNFPINDPYTTTLDFINGTNFSGLNPTSEALSGAALVAKLNDIFTRQFRFGFLVEQSPEDNNRVTLAAEKDNLGLPRPQITYDLSDYTKRGMVAAKKAADALFASMKAQQFTQQLPVNPPPGETDPSTFVVDIDGTPTRLKYYGSGHVVGTYRMGADKTQSVVDPDSQSWDHPNLYLVGSGVFPTIATGNPTLTIAALALRTADKILAREFGVTS
jgi:choline dehydrogenase-like flavoprotein